MGSKGYKVGLKEHPKNGLLRRKIIRKHFQNNFEKVQNTIFLIHKIVKNEPSKPPKGVKFLAQNPIFRDHLTNFQPENTNFQPENTPKRGPI